MSCNGELHSCKNHKEQLFGLKHSPSNFWAFFWVSSNCSFTEISNRTDCWIGQTVLRLVSPIIDAYDCTSYYQNNDEDAAAYLSSSHYCRKLRVNKPNLAPRKSRSECGREGSYTNTSPSSSHSQICWQTGLPQPKPTTLQKKVMLWIDLTQSFHLFHLHKIYYINTFTAKSTLFL